jgi:D-beta-D-heptose 7-phosphate kinase/D-beta-D-heptose 1-phosphate adenosyltransferase
LRAAAGYDAPVDPGRKVVDLDGLRAAVAEARARGARIVFTNGCFDILHAGHIDYLCAAREAGDLLVVAVNDDASVRRLKGRRRPVVPASERARVLAALEMVDLVTIFSDDTPLAVIRAVEPDVLVKGADWSADRVVGREIVERRGGRVLLAPLRPGVSTTAILERTRDD